MLDHVAQDFVLLLEPMLVDKSTPLELLISQSAAFQETKYLLSLLLRLHFFKLSLIYLPLVTQKCCSHKGERMEFNSLARIFGCLATQTQQINQNYLCTSQNAKD